ncbi:MAG: SUMF1/EgtB/PvdO family nonheme iron enzyme [bacterium]|nr:SUMF1/EgtB/PvdO family nonheme iron enzyme [bacterium]
MSSDAESPRIRRWETPIVFHDEPLRHADEAYFRFDEYATTLARLIARKDARTPMVICIDGSWGSGKTTLLRRLEKQLGTAADSNVAGDVLFLDPDERNGSFYLNEWRRVRTVRFDAWKYSGEDQLLAALLRVILMEMSRTGSFWEKVKARLSDEGNRGIDLFGGMLHCASQVIGRVLPDLDLEKFAKETPLQGATAFFDYFQVAFNRLIAGWIKGEIADEGGIDETAGVMVILVDDLDRCLPAKTVQVLEAIKLFLDQPGCVFVLGADTDIVQQAVESHYRNTGIMERAAGDYLDKIIQLRFPLPAIDDPQMQRFLADEEFARIVGGGLLEDWEILIAGADNNPRKVKGIINDLNLQWAMLANAGQADGVERTDFLRLQMLLRAAPTDFRKDLRRWGGERRMNYLKTVFQVVRGRASDADRKSVEKHLEDWRFRKVFETLATAGFEGRMDAALIETCLSMRSVDSAESPSGDKPKTRPGGWIKGPDGSAPRSVETGADSRFVGDLELLRVPAGDFIMGSETSNAMADSNEHPQHTVTCLDRDYWLARHPVTNRQFNIYLAAEGPEVLNPVSDDDLLDHPVTNVSWRQAMAYCEWLNGIAASAGLDSGKERISLPSEAEWEKAARGTQANEWPWGNEFDAGRANCAENGPNRTTRVGAFSPDGDGVFGHADLSGNVWELTRSSMRDYPYDPEPDRPDNLDLAKADQYVLRGGTFYDMGENVRCALRGGSLAGSRTRNIGFRVVLSPFL